MLYGHHGPAPDSCPLLPPPPASVCLPKYQVYRLSEADIGCSLAEAAERKGYEAWLRKAAATPNSVHVVYINTSLVTKALSHVGVEGHLCLAPAVP